MLSGWSIALRRLLSLRDELVRLLGGRLLSLLPGVGLGGRLLSLLAGVGLAGRLLGLLAGVGLGGRLLGLLPGVGLGGRLLGLLPGPGLLWLLCRGLLSGGVGDGHGGLGSLDRYRSDYRGDVALQGGGGRPGS